ncbi:hypothetical protein BYT27DRAFT_6963068 [Phlegmacium glaucopus]|nr:hypothetical protein BYT27DRAFT_6963068 [Phlegmacium glaucopus]
MSLRKFMAKSRLGSKSTSQVQLGARDNQSQKSVDSAQSSVISVILSDAGSVLRLEDNRGIVSETRIKEERAEHLEEMRIVMEAREKLAERVKKLEEETRIVVEEREKFAERVKRLEEELRQAGYEHQQQTSKFIIDRYQKEEEEIKKLKQEKKRIQQVAERDKQESLNEVRRSNETIAARWKATLASKDAETVKLKAKQDDMQRKLEVMTGDLLKSQKRAAELEWANQLQAKRIVGQDTYKDIAVVRERRSLIAGAAMVMIPLFISSFLPRFY